MDDTKARVLSILTEVVARTGNVLFHLQKDTLFCDGMVLVRAFGPLSESGYAARVRRLCSRLGLSGVATSRLAHSWDRAIQKGEPITKEELIRLAHVEACHAAEISGPLGKWRQNVLARLENVWPELHHVERFDQPPSTQVRRKVLELFPIIQHWPETLLTGPDWAYAESPFGTIKPMPLDEVWVDIHFVDAEHIDDLVAGSAFADFQDRRYIEQLGNAVSPECRAAPPVRATPINQPRRHHLALPSRSKLALFFCSVSLSA